MQSYQFFLSYAAENYKNSRWNYRGNSGNYLDDFFKDVCKVVSDITEISQDQVGYREQDFLKIGEQWSINYLSGLQNSRVLLAILSPHYFKSIKCGREFQFFKENLKLLEQKNCPAAASSNCSCSLGGYS